MNKLNQLPSELLSLILTYVNNKDLPSCTLINKFFYREAMLLLWRTIDIGSEKACIAFTICLIQSPNAPGHHVRSLSFANCLELESLGNNNISLYHVPLYCPHLTSLDIWCGRIYGPVAYRNAHATFVSAGHYCKQLTKLDLYNCVYSDDDDLFDALKDAPLTQPTIQSGYGHQTAICRNSTLGFASVPIGTYSRSTYMTILPALSTPSTHTGHGLI